MMSRQITRNQVEEFLYREAALLDDWKLPEWLALFTDDAHYQVPSTSVEENASPDDTLFFIADDRFRLGERVARLGKRGAHAEFPRSKTRHMVTNVLIESVNDDELQVRAAFYVHRSKEGNTDTYVGHYLYKLCEVDGALRIRLKRCTLDHDTLRPQGRVSIIL
jgi:p-cumate 2,3-dioxygenase subunit beta